ncbi:uncharacterized protein I206_100749 [Kwoniella pini CBS 10737]|uniref:Ubiquitin-like domain-containing protein n=1 Tax=Kwoniella pini CBS 10737 TaxID=1296096 RepID=A0A1B9ICT7_9TREE|nr:uncharacterized protein I206_00578 [Kwoniella pini CBS 10737]OCF53277.1 hypothetical protein I206_00578 [Kwoniella pini CBS 10737]
MLMIFVGTEHEGGNQFHVWIKQKATIEDLIEAISKHELISNQEFIIQHSEISIKPLIPLIKQGILNYSIFYLFKLEELRKKEIKRKKEQKIELEKRGRYKSEKDGKLKLRRRTRKDLIKLKEKLDNEKRGNGFLPCFKYLNEISKEEFPFITTTTTTNSIIHKKQKISLLSDFSFISIDNNDDDDDDRNKKKRIENQSLMTSIPLKNSLNDIWLKSSLINSNSTAPWSSSFLFPLNQPSSNNTFLERPKFESPQTKSTISALALNGLRRSSDHECILLRSENLDLLGSPQC